MAVPQDSTFGTFADGGDLAINDIVVGLRDGINTRFNATGFPGLYLPLIGGTMAGAINMDGFTITALPAPVSATEAVNKAYADSLVVGEALTEVNDTNVTLSLGGAPANSLLHAVSLTLGWTGQLAVPRGGTGAASFTAYSVLCGGTTSTGAMQNVSGVGTANQVLVSQGAGALPQWASVPGLVPAALTEVNDTNVTLTLGGTPATSLLQAVSLTLGWTGTLAETRGGTGQSTYALGDTLYASAANSLSKLAGNITAVKQYLSQTGTGAVSAAPAWATVDGGDITGAALTKTDDTNVTMSLGGTPATALLRAASMTLGWTGQLSVARGGTGLAAITAHYLPIGNGTTALTLLAPSATSGIPLISQGAAADPAYGTAVVSGGGTGNTTFTAYSLIAAGTTATGAFQNVSGVGTLNQVLVSQGAGALPQWGSVPGLSPAALTKTDDTNVTLTLGGTPSTALLQAASLTLGWTGSLAVARGGSGNNTFTAYSVLCAGTTATGAFQNVSGVGSSGQVLTSNGAAALPTWQPVSGSGTVNSGTINQLGWYAATGTAVSGLATANNGVLVTSAGGVPSISTTLPSGLAMQTPASIVLTNASGTALSLSAGSTTGYTPSYLSNASVSNTVNGASGSYQASAAHITLTQGTWRCKMYPVMNFGASSVGCCANYLTGFFGADGANNSTPPTAISSTVTGQINYNGLSGGGTYNPMPNQANTGNFILFPLECYITVASGTQAVYAVFNASYTTATNFAWGTFIEAFKVSN